MSFRIKNTVFLTFIAIILQFDTLIAQTTRLVPSSYSTIAAAISAAVNGDTIDITGTITEAQINVTKNLIIRGHGTTNTIIINAGGSSSVFMITAGNPTIKDMTIKNGQYGVNSSNTNLTISGCDIVNNSKSGVINNSISNTYTSNIRNSNISYNGGGNFQGGGVHNSSRAILIISNCNITYNTISGGTYTEGGGVFNDGDGTCTINNCNITNNTLSGSHYCLGGGIFNSLRGTCTVNNSNICNNTITASSYNLGCGIYNEGTFSINNCCISNNASIGATYNLGGGINHDRGDLTINNSTLGNNSLTTGTFLQGGGIYINHAYCTINNCTISSNKLTATNVWGLSGAGVYSGSISGTTTIIKNSILAQNIVQGVINKDFAGTITSYGYNLVGQNPAPGFTSTDLVGANPLLDTLKNNGGPTMTMALLNNSPAIDAAAKTDIYGNMVLFDQRNSKRYSINDIGAFEKNSSVEQIKDNICLNFRDQAIIKIILFSVDTATVTSFIFNTLGTTSPSEILSARLYFTATSNNFSTANPYGQVYHAPNGSFTITDSIRIRGVNFFWLAYHINSTAVPGHNFDASANQIRIDTFNYFPDNTAPAGYRTIPIVTASFQINDTTQCLNGNKFIFTNKSATSSGVLSSQWYFGDSTASSSSSPSHQYIYPDTFDVKLVVRMADGCADSVINSAIVFPDPIVKISVNDSIQCFSNNRFVFIDSSKISSGRIDSLFWSFGDGNTSMGKLVLHSYLTPGTYHVNLLALSSFSCFNAANLIVKVDSNPQAAFNINDTSQCLNGNLFQFTDQTIGNPTHRTAWFFGDGVHDTLKNPTHIYVNKGKYKVRLIVSTGLGCFDTLARTVTVKSSPITAFTVNDSTQCLKGNSFTFVNKSSIDTGNLSFNWDFGDLTNSILTNPLHAYTKPDTFSVILTATSAQACSSSTKATMMVFPQPKTAVMVNDTIQCFNGNLFSFHPSFLNPLSNYIWDFGDGNSISSAEPDHHYLTTGNYHVILKETNQYSCVDTGWKDVFVAISPIAAISVNDSVQCINGNLFVFNSAGTPGMKSYQWLFGDGNIGTGTSVSHSYLTENTFLVKLIATSNQDCADTAFKNVITQPKPRADFMIQDSTQCFAGNSFIFNNKSDVLSIFSDWSFGDGNYAGTANSIHSYLTSGKFPVKLKVTSKELCTDSILKWVNVKPNPSTPEVSSNSPVCLGDEINLQATSSEKVDYKWTSDHGFSSIIQNPVISHARFTDSGEYAAKAVLDGCESGTAKLNINILPLPIFDLGKDMVFCTGDQKILDPGDFQDYLWQDNSTSRTFTVTDPGTYFVTVTGENQCKNTDTIHLISRCPTQVFIPAAFTPTGDNHNETFRIVISNIIDYRLIIYDRWGEEIFSSHDPATTWNGKYKGIICQTGYYYYSLTYLAELGGIKVINGLVMLMR